MSKLYVGKVTDKLLLIIWIRQNNYLSYKYKEIDGCDLDYIFHGFSVLP